MKQITFCIVTCDAQRIKKFLRHHKSIMTDKRLEFYLHCTKNEIEEVNKFLKSGPYNLKVFQDDITLKISKKRNMLLNKVTTPFCMLLDDDSFLKTPKKEIQYILNAIQRHEWILITAEYYNKKRTIVKSPITFSKYHQGTGIEWNQIFSTKIIREIGGLHEDFGIGAKWKSGEALNLMAKLFSKKYSQATCGSAKIIHPIQSPTNLQDSLTKFLLYRYGFGASLSNIRKIIPKPLLIILLFKSIILAPISSFTAILRKDIPLFCFKFLSPWFVILGFFRNYYEEKIRKI